jgi:hypothetical protein
LILIDLSFNYLLSNDSIFILLHLKIVDNRLML